MDTNSLPVPPALFYTDTDGSRYYSRGGKITDGLGALRSAPWYVTREAVMSGLISRPSYRVGQKVPSNEKE